MEADGASVEVCGVWQAGGSVAERARHPWRSGGRVTVLARWWSGRHL